VAFQSFKNNIFLAFLLCVPCSIRVLLYCRDARPNCQFIPFDIIFPLPQKSSRKHHNLAFSSRLFTPTCSSNTYPAATGLIQEPASTPFGARFNRSVKNTGCRIVESRINVAENSSQAFSNRAFSSAGGGIAWIWFLGSIANGGGNMLVVLEVEVDVDAELGACD